MNKNIEDKPLYRLFNVIVFLSYLITALTTVVAAFIGYGERKTISATVHCRDGSSWDALKPKNILYNSQALCGICTKRNADGSKYQECEFGEIDYSSFSTELVKESWSWSTLIYPLITLTIGFGLVDAVRIILIYIFSGKIAPEKSILLNLITLFVSDDANSQEDALNKSFPLLLNIVGKEDVLNATKMLAQSEQELEQAESNLNNFLKKIGRDKSFFESKEVFDLDADKLQAYFTIDNNLKDLQLANFRLKKYLEALEETNRYLENGENIEEAKKRLKKIQTKNNEESAKLEVQRELSKAIGEELIVLKKKYGKNYKDKMVNMDDVLKRIYERHPDWKKEEKKKL